MASCALLCPYDQYRAVGVSDDTVGDAPHQEPSVPAQASATHHYQARAYLLGQGDYMFIRPSYP